jgi:hypothetical protein
MDTIRHSSTGFSPTPASAARTPAASAGPARSGTP